MTRLKVLLDTSFRTVDEIFSTQDRETLYSSFDVLWGRDTPMPRNEFLAALPDVDAVVFGGWRHGNDSSIRSATRLRALLEVAGGHEHAGLDYPWCLEQGIAVGSCAPAFGAVVAEMALALALDAMRGVTAADRKMRVGTEAWLHDGNESNSSLLGASVGFIGCGGISRHLQVLLAPFGVTIRGYDPPMPTEVLVERGITPSSLTKTITDSSVLFVLAAPTPDNRGLVSRELLKLLRRDQTLIVVSRASLVDFDAMVELASEGRFRLGVDVYPDEPIGIDHPIRQVESSVLVPHLAGAMPSALRSIGHMVLSDLQALAKGEVPGAMQYLLPENLEGLVQR